MNTYGLRPFFYSDFRLKQDEARTIEIFHTFGPSATYIENTQKLRAEVFAEYGQNASRYINMLDRMIHYASGTWEELLPGLWWRDGGSVEKPELR